MRQTPLVVMILAVVLLAGCAARRTVWTHPGYTPQLWARDSYECERDAQQPGAVLGHQVGNVIAMIPTGPVTDQQMMARCLKARGWTLVYAE